MPTMTPILTMRRVAARTGVWIAPDIIAQPYQIRAMERPTATTGRIFSVIEATIGVMTSVSIVVTDWSIQLAISPRLTRVTAPVAIIALLAAVRESRRC